MSRQFTFYLTPKDSLGLKVHLRDSLDAVFVADESDRPAPNLIRDLTTQVEKETIVFLTRHEYLDRLSLDDIKERRVWSIDSLLSPVIEFTNCYFDSKTIGPGRMYVSTGFYDDSDNWVDKPTDFLEWVDRVFKATKKALSRDKELDSYIGGEAKRLSEEGEITISSFI